MILTVHERSVEKELLCHLVEQFSLEVVPTKMTGGRTNRVWCSGDVIIKIYDLTTRNPLFANNPNLEAVLLRDLLQSGFAPRYIAHGETEGLSWLVYAHVPGRSWNQDTALVAKALAAVHRMSCGVDLPLGPNGSSDLERQTQAILQLCTMADDLYSLKPNGCVEPTDRRTLLHGDPVPGNIIALDAHVTFIDWQCPSFGDAAEDLAVFLSPAMQWLYRGYCLSSTEIDQFLDAYPNPNVVGRYLHLKPWFHWRMAAYCHWRGDVVARDLEIQAM